MGRPPCCDKTNVKRGLWTAEEDAKILAYVANNGIGNWTQVPKKAGLNRCGKSCRLRWTNYLRPDLKHEDFTQQEEELIVQFHAAIGSRWSLIAKQLPGRTDNDVKNYWNTKLKKKLAKMGIDPITHKPYSRILSEYESISSSCLTSTHSIRSLNKTLPISRSFSYPEISSPDILSRSPCPSPPTGMPIMDLHHLGQLGISAQESLSHYVFEEISPSSSSSSSSSSVISNGKPSSHMLGNDSSTAAVVMRSWSEPGFDDNIPTADIIEEEYNFQKFLETDSGDQVLDKTHTSESAGRSEMSNYCEPSGSPVSSFVKALLDHDSEMQLDFPSFGDILDY